jgi:hypothetical protein
MFVVVVVLAFPLIGSSPLFFEWQKVTCILLDMNDTCPRHRSMQTSVFLVAGRGG